MSWQKCGCGCDWWHKLLSFGVACPDHSMPQLVGKPQLIVPPSEKACPACLELDEEDAERNYREAGTAIVAGMRRTAELMFPAGLDPADGTSAADGDVVEDKGEQ